VYTDPPGVEYVVGNSCRGGELMGGERQKKETVFYSKSYISMIYRSSAIIMAYVDCTLGVFPADMYMNMCTQTLGV